MQSSETVLVSFDFLLVSLGNSGIFFTSNTDFFTRGTRFAF